MYIKGDYIIQLGIEKIKSSAGFIKMNLGVLVLGIFVLISNVFFSRIYPGLASDEAYLGIDPSQEAQFMRDADKYTANIEEDADGFEIGSLIDESDGYASKELGDNSVVTQIANKDFEYIVQNGETVTGIAKKFNLHVASIVQMNNIDVGKIENLKPGDKLMIPANDISDSKDWLVQLNNKKEEERQIALKKEQERLAKQKKLASANRSTVTRSSSSSRTASVNAAAGSSVNGYPYGWCTYYVATRRSVPSGFGNAGQWLGNAARAGYSTGDNPVPGAIMVTSESWWGHVAYVESVNGDSFTVSEMNYKGWGVTSYRTLNANSSMIKGFIY